MNNIDVTSIEKLFLTRNNKKDKVEMYYAPTTNDVQQYCYSSPNDIIAGYYGNIKYTSDYKEKHTKTNKDKVVNTYK